MEQIPERDISAEVDPLLSHIQTESLPLHLQHIPEEIITKGYAVVPGVLTAEECEDALQIMWDFVKDVSGNMVKSDDPRSWYPKHQLKPSQDENFNESISTEEEDPWPHTGYSSFPDMFQSFGAGYLLGPDQIYHTVFRSRLLLISHKNPFICLSMCKKLLRYLSGTTDFGLYMIKFP